MTANPDVDELVAPLRDDNVSGASELSHTAAEVLRRAAVRMQAGSVAELRWGLGEVCRKVLDAQPAMAPMVTLVRRVLDAVESEESVEGARLAAANAAEAFRSGLEQRLGAVVESARALLPPDGAVGTISASGSVRELLISEGSRPGFRVICFESRPMKEGRSLAADLAGGGVNVTFAVDAALDALAHECDVVLLGADSVGSEGIVNKIGSSALARAAKQAGTPVYALADETKFLPSGYPQLVDDARPAEEVWKDAPEGVRVWNRYFEIVPWALMTGVATEGVVLSRRQALDRLDAIDLPAGLKGWAARRRDG